ncbi:hypothetical protein [Caldimonas sp. KR1-144]|uniref:hypothetical protein n=1 Tax=Caldimonas sp. KR1-144 TaxID=3400911 RepID=UPI003BFA8C07
MAFPQQDYGGSFKPLAGPPGEGIALTWTGEALSVRACGYEFQAALRLTEAQEAALLDRLLTRRRIKELAAEARESVTERASQGTTTGPDECAEDASG